jgi:sugar lactone lactonase YvrE
LAVDSDANIYVSNLGGAAVRVYDRVGHLLSSFGSGGIQLGEFLAPTGLWIDGANRIYVADTDNRRVQVFQLSTSLNP